MEKYGLRVAFGCQAGVGKSEAANYLIQKYGGIEVTFAAPLYDILYYAQKRCGFELKKDRKFLQWVGSEWARKQSESVWVDTALNEIYSCDKNDNIFVSDVRYPNEFQALKQAGFIMVRIIRRVDNSAFLFGSGTQTHSSETSLLDVPLDYVSGWNIIVINNGTIKEFQNELDGIVEKL